MEKESSTELHVNVIERMMVAPCLPSPRTILQLSPVDNLIRGFGSILLVYNASHSVSADPAKVIREALSKVLVYYSPFAGRLRNKENGEREVDCTGEGALFVEAMADNDLSVLDDLDDYNPSFQQLLFSPPPDTDMEDLHPLVLQITQFRCGGFVLGVSLYQSLCDGKGLGQFLNGIAEMARGEIKPSIKPIWNRELVEAEDCMHLQFHHHEFINPPQLVEKIVQTSLVINFEKINCIKRCLMEECKEYLSTFEVVAALVWLARSKAFRIPHSENVKLLSAMDMRRSFNPPLPKGYYGNVVGTACAMHNVAELLSGSLLHAAMIIKKSKLSLNENFRSRIGINPSELVGNMKYENVFLLSDWRRLGYYEVDFGWGDAVNVSPIQVQWERGFSLPDLFAFLRPTTNMLDGIKIVMSIPSSKVKLFKIEMEDMIREYVTQMCHSKL